MSIILRNTKGSPLTHVEMDNNLNELDTRINDLEAGVTSPLVFVNGNDINVVESPADTITISNTSTLNTVTGRGATTTNDITVGQATVNSSLNFTSPNGLNTYTASIDNSDVFNFSGDSGVLFSVTETPDSTLKVFDSVNNLVLEVAQNGNVILNESVGYTLVGSGTAVGTDKLQVTGAVNITGDLTVGGVINGGGLSFSTLSGIPTTVSGYGITDFDTSVDTHLNTSTATTGQILSWNGSDYEWTTEVKGGLTITGGDLELIDFGIIESITTKSGTPTPTIEYDTTSGSIFWQIFPTQNWTANLVNFTLDEDRSKNIIIAIKQDATQFMPTALEINGVPYVIKWANGYLPVPKQDAINVVSFTCFNVAGTFHILGQMVEYF